MRYLPLLLVLAVWIYAFIDCLSTPEEKVRNLPKAVWVLIILFFGEVLLGPVAWLLAGRPRASAPAAHPPSPRGGFVPPDDNPEFLRSLNDRTRDRNPDHDPDA